MNGGLSLVDSGAGQRDRELVNVGCIPQKNTASA